MQKSPSAVFQALLSENDGQETGTAARSAEVIRAAISAGEQCVCPAVHSAHGSVLLDIFGFHPVGRKLAAAWSECRHRPGTQRDEKAQRDADLASLIHMGSKVWEGDGVEVTPEQVLKTLLGELFVEDCFLSDVRDLAEGGFATVQSAHLTHPNGMKQLVAIKRLRPERLGSEESLTEFIAVRQSDSSPGFELFARRH